MKKEFERKVEENRGECSEKVLNLRDEAADYKSKVRSCEQRSEELGMR